MLKSESEFVPNAVVWDLRTAGAKGVPALRAILKDDKLLKYHDGAVRSLAKAGGADAGPELVKRLELELAYWRKVGPDLPEGWWNGAGGKVEWDEVTRLRDHYCVAHAAVLELRELRHAGAREVVTEFGKFWKSLGEVSQLAETCDATLKALPRKRASGGNQRMRLPRHAPFNLVSLPPGVGVIQVGINSRRTPVAASRQPESL